MRKARFTEHQIITVLKSVEAGCTVKDVCREAAISEASYYNWKAKYGGMEAADIKKKSRTLRMRIYVLNRCLLISALSAGHLKTSSKKAFKTSDKV
ncbi:TPA: transposase [Klebsiella aerogenes]